MTVKIPVSKLIVTFYFIMFLILLFNDIKNKHFEFVSLLAKALQFNQHIVTIIPSVLFLVFSMRVIYRFTHKNVTRFRRSTYRDALYREIAFQWFYLYVTRAWLYVVKALRLASDYLEDAVMKSGGTQSNAMCVHVLIFLIFVVLSITPFLLTVTVYNVDDGLDQNILFWIPPNRWTRSELGPAGRLMERPPEFAFTDTKFPHAYETKRSVSSENMNTTSSVEVLRCCKSGYIPEQISSLEELIRGDDE